MADDASIKVGALTMERIRLGARLHECNMQEFVEAAVDAYVVSHRDELVAGFDHAREVLGLT